ncbi:MAG: cytochrome b/b6 domain-containing protein [Sulfuricellaceae bacterium]|nr:cytochrome b/b6 domain-containing protein [Sulfuricellaceae bacterium]
MAGRLAVPLESAKSLEVWDIPVRVFHWFLVAFIVWQWASAATGGNLMEYHLLGGYAILTLLLFRLVWGMVGSHTARFTAFVRGPRATLAYLRAVKAGSAPPSVGHNPAGGWMVLALLAGLLAQAGLGLFATDDIMTSGPLAGRVPDAVSELLSSLHSGFFYVLLGLMALHVAAILYYRFAKGENLVTAMVTGKAAHAADTPQPKKVSPWLALLSLAVIGAAVAALILLAGR